MSGIESWDPSVSELKDEHAIALRRAAKMLDQLASLSNEDQTLLRPTMQFSGKLWRSFCQGISSEEISDWIRVLTRLERDCNGFEAGDKSPVLVLIRVLRERGNLPDGLFNWIRQNSNNRFLPYGSLASRL